MGFSFSVEKIVFAMLASIGGFFFPLASLAEYIFIFVLIDTITGMMSARNRGEELQSKKLKKVISKLIFYLVTIICAHIFDICIDRYDLYAAHWATGFLLGVEGFSILENMYGITGNRAFYLLTQFWRIKFQEKTGVDIKKAPKKKRGVK